MNAITRLDGNYEEQGVLLDRVRNGQTRPFSQDEIDALDPSTWGDSDLLRDDGVRFKSNGLKFIEISGSKEIAVLGQTMNGYNPHIPGYKFLDIIGWTIGAGTLGAVFDNTTLPVTAKYGEAPHVRCGNTIAGDAAQQVNNKVIAGGGSIDISNAVFISLKIYVNGHMALDTLTADNYGNIDLLIRDSAAGQSYLPLISKGGSLHVGWNNVVCKLSDAGAGADFTIIDEIRLDINAGVNSDAVQFWITDVHFGGVPQNFKTPVVITTDDSHDEHYRVADIFNKYGIPITSFHIESEIDGLNGLSSTQAQEMYDKGNAFCAHSGPLHDFTKNHPSMLAAKNALIARGFIRDNMHLYGAYPNGSNNQACIDAAIEYGFKGMRALTGIARIDANEGEASRGGFSHENLVSGGIADPFRIIGQQYNGAGGGLAALAAIDLAYTFKAAQIIIQHDFATSTPESELEIMAQGIRTRMDAGTVEALTFPQFCQKYDTL